MKEENKTRKTEMYLCGERYSKDYQEGDYFFDTVMNFFGLRWLREGHSGKLSSYLYWLVLGAVFVVSVSVILWV